MPPPRNCWDFACHVQSELFGRELPRLAVPDGFARRWVLEEFAHHEERRRWRQVQDGPGGLVQAADGALVLMAHLRFPAHIGVWLRPEQRIHSLRLHMAASPARRRLRRARWAQFSSGKANDEHLAKTCSATDCDCAGN
jgi:hypothetical protein